MFAQATGGAANPWTMSASIVVQVAIVGVAILVPLWRIEALPSVPLAPKPAPPHVMLVEVPESYREPVRSSASLLPMRAPVKPIQIPTRVPTRPEMFIDDVDAFPEPTATGGASPTLSAGVFEPKIIAAVPPASPQIKEKPAVTTVAPPNTLYRVGGNVTAPVLRSAPKPMYPPLARQARVQGTVRVNGVISRDGTVRSLELISGHPLLVNAALAAVRQWLYDPARLNGQPVDVILVIDVNFTLSQ